MLLAMAVASAACAAIPAALTLANLLEYRAPASAAGLALPRVSAIVPARNEAEGIASCLHGVLASTGVEVDVLVVDDGSTDGTAGIVERMAAADPRVRLMSASALPPGWNGKQHACWLGAEATDAAVLCFLDADVRLRPEALARMAALLVRERCALVSGFPREVTGGLLEKLLIPLIHFVLLGLLPMRFQRTTNMPGFAAGCGQFLMVEREAYLRAGGHSAIRHTMHDGLLLPRLFRQKGFRTRVADLTHLASCRMYRTAAATWNGLAKNATEGLAAPARIVPMTLLLGLGQVAPLPLLSLAWQHTSFIIPFLGPPVRIGMAAVWVSAAAVVLSYLPRLIDAGRFRQSWLGALLHPLGVLLLLLLQWYALIRKLLGRPAAWKAREYPAN